MEDGKRWLTITWKILRGVLIGAALAVLAFVAFFWFRVKSDGHLALRSAKNARYAIETVGIEYYGESRSVYSSLTPDGLNKGVAEKVRKYTGAEGEILLQSYDMRENKVLGMRYTEDHYIVNFSIDENGNEQWRLSYLLDLDLF